MMKDKIKKLAEEIAWTVGNAIIDSGNEDFDYITLKQLVAIRDVVETETYETICDLIDKKEFEDIIRNI